MENQGRARLDAAIEKLNAVPCWALLVGDLASAIRLNERSAVNCLPDNVCAAYADQAEAVIANAKQWAERCDARKVINL